MKDTFIVACYDGETIKQIGPVFDSYGLAANELKTAVAAYNGYDNPSDLPDGKKCDFEGEWKQDNHLWKILGSVRK